MSKTIKFQFDGYDAIYEAEEWCFEDTVQQIKWNECIPFYTEIKLYHDRINALDITDPENVPVNISSGNDQKPTTVRKRTRKAKPKS